MKFFVYGIFLEERMRGLYGMSGPRYATVRDYATYGGHIVQAKYEPDKGLSLTGLVVNVPVARIESLDAMEGGYDRITVTTTDGEEVFMYAGRNRA